jgi:hypothetical protein
MSYFDAYRNRLLSQGSSGKKAVENATINLVIKNFSASFGYKIVKVDQVDTDVIYSNGKDHVDGELLFKPQYVPVIGSIVEIDTAKYLIVDTKKHEIYPTAEIKLCNSNFPLPGEQVCTEHTNDFGETYEECVSSSPIELPCIVENFFYKDGTNEAINLAKGQINVTMSYFENENIAINKEFIMYSTRYKITDIDYTKSLNGIGLIVLKAEKI